MRKCSSMHFPNLDHFAVSSLITRMTTDVTVIQNMVSAGFRPITRGPSLLIMGIGLSFYMNPRLAFVFLVCTPLLGFILSLIVRRVAPMYTKLQSMVGPPEQRCPGGADRDPCRQSFRAG